jgi:hypothetical protein
VVTVSEGQAVVYHSWNVCPVSLLPYPARKFLMKTGHSCLHCPFYADSAATHVNNTTPTREQGNEGDHYHFHFKAIHDGRGATRVNGAQTHSLATHKHKSLSYAGGGGGDGATLAPFVLQSFGSGFGGVLI